MAEYRAFDPCTLLAPVPAVLVSCRGTHPEDKPNAMTVAWAGTVNSEPPMVSVSIRKSRFSHDLVADSGEFVVNLVSTDLVKALDYCGVRSGRDEDKLAACGLKAIPAPGLRYAPAIDGVPAWLACRVHSVTDLGSHDMFIGEVVDVQVNEALLDEGGSLHLERADLVCYSHGLYQRTADVLGFFGYSVARPDVLEKRMAQYGK